MRGRAAHSRLLSRNERHVQSEEARRDRLAGAAALAHRSTLGSHQAYPKRAGGLRDCRGALPQACTVEQVGGVNADELATLNKLLHRLERFWIDQIIYQM